MPDFGDSNVTIDGCRAIGQTEKALYVEIPTVGRLWIPLQAGGDLERATARHAGRREARPGREAASKEAG